MNLLNKIKSKFNPMLNCEQVNQFIVDYLEGDLPVKTKKQFEQHLTMCPSCTPFLDHYRETIQVVHDDGQLEVPDDLIEHTIAFLREHLQEG